MGRANALRDEEKDFIRATFPQLGVTKIASKLGRSRRAVYDFIDADGLRGRVKEDAGEAERPPTDGSRAARLESLRDILERKMRDPETPPGSIAGLAREYRATLDEIDRLEGGKDDPASAALDMLAQRIAAKMPA